jgi:hypothetical protein
MFLCRVSVAAEWCLILILFALTSSLSFKWSLSLSYTEIKQKAKKNGTPVLAYYKEIL